MQTYIKKTTIFIAPARLPRFVIYVNLCYNHEMLVDRLFEPEALQAFADGRDKAILTAEQRGLIADEFILIGSSALAVHGLMVCPSDVDAIKIPPRWQRNPTGRTIHSIFNIATGRPELNLCQSDTEPSEYAPLKTTTIQGAEAEALVTSTMSYSSFEDLIADRRTVGNVATVPPDRAALSKSARGRAKDSEAIIQAHVGAMLEGNEILDSAHWKIAVGLSVARAVRSIPNVPPRMLKSADWLVELVNNDFEHPAFAASYLRSAVKVGRDARIERGGGRI